MPKRRVINPYLAELGFSDVVMIDVLPVASGSVARIVFEAVSSPWRQGIWLATDGLLRVNGVQGGQLTLWEDTAPQVVEVEIVETDGFLTLYNIWDSGRYQHHESQGATSGMIVSEIGGQRVRYACNDIGYDPAFDKLVFTVEVVLGSPDHDDCQEC